MYINQIPVSFEMQVRWMLWVNRVCKSHSNFIFFTGIYDVERIENRRQISFLLFTSGYSERCITMQNLLFYVCFLIPLSCRKIFVIFIGIFLHKKDVLPKTLISTLSKWQVSMPLNSRLGPNLVKSRGHMTRLTYFITHKTRIVCTFIWDNQL